MKFVQGFLPFILLSSCSSLEIEKILMNSVNKNQGSTSTNLHEIFCSAPSGQPKTHWKKGDPLYAQPRSILDKYWDEIEPQTFDEVPRRLNGEPKKWTWGMILSKSKSICNTPSEKTYVNPVNVLLEYINRYSSFAEFRSKEKDISMSTLFAAASREGLPFIFMATAHNPHNGINRRIHRTPNKYSPNYLKQRLVMEFMDQFIMNDHPSIQSMQPPFEYTSPQEAVAFIRQKVVEIFKISDNIRISAFRFTDELDKRIKEPQFFFNYLQKFFISTSEATFNPPWDVSVEVVEALEKLQQYDLETLTTAIKLHIALNLLFRLRLESLKLSNFTCDHKSLGISSIVVQDMRDNNSPIIQTYSRKMGDFFAFSHIISDATVRHFKSILSEDEEYIKNTRIRNPKSYQVIHNLNVPSLLFADYPMWMETRRKAYGLPLFQLAFPSADNTKYAFERVEEILAERPVTDWENIIRTLLLHREFNSNKYIQTGITLDDLDFTTDSPFNFTPLYYSYHRRKIVVYSSYIMDEFDTLAFENKKFSFQLDSYAQKELQESNNFFYHELFPKSSRANAFEEKVLLGVSTYYDSESSDGMDISSQLIFDGDEMRAVESIRDEKALWYISHVRQSILSFLNYLTLGDRLIELILTSFSTTEFLGIPFSTASINNSSETFFDKYLLSVDGLSDSFVINPEMKRQLLVQFILFSRKNAILEAIMIENNLFTRMNESPFSGIKFGSREILWEDIATTVQIKKICGIMKDYAIGSIESASSVLSTILKPKRIEKLENPTSVLEAEYALTAYFSRTFLLNVKYIDFSRGYLKDFDFLKSMIPSSPQNKKINQPFTTLFVNNLFQKSYILDNFAIFHPTFLVALHSRNIYIH